MSHTISLSLRSDPASFRGEGKEVKDRGFGKGGGGQLYGSDNVFVLLFP